jgi:hypothetical protein
MKLNMGNSTPCCAPEPTPPSEYFPEFHYSGETPMKVPDSGEMTIRFRKVADSKSVRDGKTNYSCTIEVREIVDVDSDDVEAPAKSMSGAGDALDAIMKRKMKESEEDEDED